MTVALYYTHGWFRYINTIRGRNLSVGARGVVLTVQSLTVNTVFRRYGNSKLYDHMLIRNKNLFIYPSQDLLRKTLQGSMGWDGETERSCEAPSVRQVNF